MKIKWLAHASFLIEGDGLRIITDPYEPNEIMNLPPVTETADIVVRSSDDDEAHCFVDTIPPGFDLVTATDIVDHGVSVKGVTFSAIWSEESHIHKEVVRDNAMYRFTLEGINITHLGDVGNPLSAEQMDALLGTDILLSLAGGPPTIALADLHKVIAHVKPKVVIPMHYRIPGPRFFMLPVTEFTSHYPEDTVTWSEKSEFEVTQDSLPADTHVVVLQPSLFRDE
jgi:L-ascorbate metabolism protein UlaG (beta-lactamase superfamily)